MRSSGWAVPALSFTIVACASPAPSWAPAASVPPSASAVVVKPDPLAKARALAARGVLDTGGAAALAVAEASGDPEAFAFAARCFEQGWAEERAVAAWNAVAKHPRATKELVAEASSALAARPAATAPLSETARTLALSSALRSRDPADAIRVLEAVALRGERRLLDRLGVLLERAGRDADAQRAWARARASSSAVGVTLGGLSWHVWARPVTRVVAIEDNTALMGGSEVDSGFSVDLLTGTVRATLTGTYFDTMTSLGCRDVVAAANHAVAGSCEDGHGHFIAHPTSFGTPERTSCGRAALDPKGRAAAFACKDAVWLVLPDYERKPVRVGIANTTARLALSEDAGLVAVASGGKIALFDWTGKARSSLEYDPKEPVTEVVFAGADRLVAAHERAVEVYDLKKLERVASVGVPDPPSSLHHVPGADAIDLVLGSKLARLKLPSLALEPRDTVLSSFARSPNGPFAAGVHVTDGATTQWSILDAETGVTLANGGPTHDTVERVASSQNHRWLVVATTTGVGVHDLQASTYRFEKTGRIRAMTIDDDKSEVVLVGHDGSLVRRRLDTLAVAPVDAQDALSPLGQPGFARGGGVAVVAETDAGTTNGNATLEVREETTGRVLRTLPAAAPIAVARKTGWVAGRTGTHEVAVWDDEGKERMRTSLPEIVDVAMSDDGTRLAVAGRHRFQVLRLDSDAGAELFKDGAHEGAPGVSSVAWLGPSLLAVSGGDGIRVFDVAKGRSSAEAAYWGDGGWAWLSDSFSAGWAKRLPEELSFETYSAGYYWEALRDDAKLGTLLGLSRE